MFFAAHRFEPLGLQAQRRQDRRRDLLVLDPVADNLPVKLRVGDDQQHVRVVLGETAVLGDLGLALAVNRARDRLEDDIRRASQRRVAELILQSLAGVDLLNAGVIAVLAV